jgi:bifunctional UDP-N-acetylglucosamine pyrophosphorylase/glucosamine-1-phosphate N-acetyltransferase
MHKNSTTIGDRVFIGSDTALVAPVRIGHGAYVAAGSVITENVPADALGIGRSRQATKRGWAAKRRRELAAESKPLKPRTSSRSKTRSKRTPRKKSSRLSNRRSPSRHRGSPLKGRSRKSSKH